MSWSTYTVGLPDQITDRVNSLTPPGEEFSERDDQVKAAKVAVLSIIDSGAIGTGEAFSVSLSGHANTDHKPAAGWANDALTISVVQVAASQVQTFDQQQEQIQKNLQ